jgi:YidC/Oxa1 family membrane protein insertase
LEIKEKYKDDKEKFSQEQMKLYKELGINPFASCLPMLIQFPIIIGLYQTIIQAMSNTPLDMLRLVRHIWPQVLDINAVIPLNSNFLWMQLGQPERLHIPFLNFGIPILGIVVMITTYMQSKLMTPPSANPGDQTAQMTGMMNLYMPFFMGYLALTLASGLSLYFVVSNVVGILQYAILGKANWKSLIPTLPKFMSTGSNGGSGKGIVKKSAAHKQEPRGKQPNRGKNESRKNNAGNNRANS